MNILRVYNKKVIGFIATLLDAAKPRPSGALMVTRV